MDHLETKIQDGYIFSLQGNVVESFHLWKEVFEFLIKMGEEKNIRDFQGIYKSLGEEHHLLIWFKDFQFEISRFAELSPENHKVVKDICKMYLDFFSEESNSDMKKDMGKILAQSHFVLGDIKEAEDFFRTTLELDKQWMDGWIAWVDCWLKYGEGYKGDYMKALNILNSALKYSLKGETKEVYQRFVQVYEKLEDQENYDLAKGKLLEISLEDYVGDFFEYR